MNWYRNLKIGTKLIIGYLIVALIAGGIGVMGVSSIQKLQSDEAYLYSNMTVPLGQLIYLSDAYDGMVDNVKKIVLATDTSVIANLDREIEKQNSTFAADLKVFKEKCTTTESVAVCDEIFSQKKQMDDMMTEIIALTKQGKKTEAVAMLNSSEFSSVNEQIKADVQQLLGLKMEIVKQTAAADGVIADRATLFTVILLILGVMVSVMLGLFSAKSINKPIYSLIKAQKKMADGDLTASFTYHSRNELGMLADSFNTMVFKVNHTLLQIDSAADEVAASSRQVSMTSVALASGATEQAASIQELTAALEEVASRIKLSAANAIEANQLADHTRECAVSGNQQMEKMLASMEKVVTSFESITKISGMIEKIALQTKILALNATMEGARAGKYGHGFAVVAADVKKLADDSAEAAKMTAELIEGSKRDLIAGEKNAYETAAALTEIVGSTEKVHDLVVGITDAAKEEEISVAQINQGVNEISMATQSTSATSEESAAASEFLAEQAQLLADQVDRFSLNKSRQRVYFEQADRRGVNMEQKDSGVPLLNAFISGMKTKISDFRAKKAADQPEAAIIPEASADKIAADNRVEEESVQAEHLTELSTELTASQETEGVIKLHDLEEPIISEEAADTDKLTDELAG